MNEVEKYGIATLVVIFILLLAAFLSQQVPQLIQGLLA